MVICNMISLFRIGLISILLTLGFSNTGGADTFENIVTTRLSNGLELLFLEDHTAPIVAIKIFYHVGVKDEPRGRTGITGLCT